MAEKLTVAGLERQLADARRRLLQDKARLREFETALQEFRRRFAAQMPRPATSQQIKSPAEELSAWENELIRMRIEVEALHTYKRSRMFRLTSWYYRLFGLPILGPILTRLRRVGLFVTSHTIRRPGK